ncbi:hypothetical protein I4U23_016864 [Adineta vaga]|nr:hypothetical protein I4U23_016864 [Adineta vaga]
MNPYAPKFKPIHKTTTHIDVTNLTKYEENLFREIFQEWTSTSTFNILLKNWSLYREKTLSLMKNKEDLTFLLLNVSSLNRYLIEIYKLIEDSSPAIITLNETFHDDKATKCFTQHFFNYNVFTNLTSIPLYMKPQSIVGTSRFCYKIIFPIICL